MWSSLFLFPGFSSIFPVWLQFDSSFLVGKFSGILNLNFSVCSQSRGSGRPNQILLVRPSRFWTQISSNLSVEDVSPEVDLQPEPDRVPSLGTGSARRSLQQNMWCCLFQSPGFVDTRWVRGPVRLSALFGQGWTLTITFHSAERTGGSVPLCPLDVSHRACSSGPGPEPPGLIHWFVLVQQKSSPVQVYIQNC